MAGFVTVVAKSVILTVSGHVAGLTTGVTFQTARAIFLHTVLSHVVWTATFVTRNLGEPSGLLWLRALPGDVTGLVTVETTLYSTFASDVASFTTVVTLLELDSSWHGTVCLNVTWLVTVVTQSFGITVFG